MDSGRIVFHSFNLPRNTFKADINVCSRHRNSTKNKPYARRMFSRSVSSILSLSQKRCHLVVDGHPLTHPRRLRGEVQFVHAAVFEAEVVEGSGEDSRVGQFLLLEFLWFLPPERRSTWSKDNGSVFSASQVTTVNKWSLNPRLD
jgi:hypothetical protein